MNDIFDFRRFGWYARKEFSENWKALALGMVASVVVTSFSIYGRWQSVKSGEQWDFKVDTTESLGVLLILGIMFASSYVWRAFSDSKDAFSALTLPVSVLERFVFAWLIAVPFVALISFVISQTLWSIAKPFFLQEFPNFKVEMVLENANLLSNLDWYFFVFCLTAPSLFMWGALTMGRLNFLKTLGIVFFTGLISIWLQDKHLATIFPNSADISSALPVPIRRPFINIQTNQGVYANNLVSTFEGIYSIWWLLILPLVMYTSIFLKLKEKEI